MMREPASKAGDRGCRPRFVSVRGAAASTRSPASLIPAPLVAAIDAAWLVLRQPTDDVERVAVHCDALGGPFIYIYEEAARRVAKRFPELPPSVVAAAADFLGDRVRAFLRPIHTETRQRSSWVHGWRGDY